jgi:hypothetical protein
VNDLSKGLLREGRAFPMRRLPMQARGAAKREEKYGDLAERAADSRVSV